MSTETLIRAAQGGDRAASEQLVVENTGLIWSIARRYFGRGTEPDDLYQLGCLGFLKAVQGFDFDYGTCFSTYAVPKIAGEIRRFLRDDGPVKVSRGMKERAGLIRAAQVRLEERLGREPTLSQLAEETGLEPEEVAAAQLSAEPVLSLQGETGESGLILEGLLGDDGLEEKTVERLALERALELLPQRERTVIQLRYYKGLTQSQCARVIGVSQVQISRLERRALHDLRTQLAD